MTYSEPLSPQWAQRDRRAAERCRPVFARIEEIKERNQLKMQTAFIENRVSAAHLSGSTGYGYDDGGRAALERVFAQITGSEAALLRHQFMSGTHAIGVALFGLLRPGDKMVAVTGRPYDTLQPVIGLGSKKADGSLADFGVVYEEIPMGAEGPDLAAIAAACKEAAVCYVQRSRGYANRPSLSLQQIGEIAAAAKGARPDIHVVVDNCYGEFTHTTEPTQHGADLIIGSLIKNPGGGIASTGGYIAGKKALVEKCAQRFTVPGVGAEIGATAHLQRELFLGLYHAPAATAEALKTAAYASALFGDLGFAVTPAFDADRNDIITAVDTLHPEILKALCRGIQGGSAVDSSATPEPWPMPGYDSDIIMAAGAFTLGSSIELSADGPLRPPYTAYIQGGLFFAPSRRAVLLAAQMAAAAKEKL